VPVKIKIDSRRIIKLEPDSLVALESHPVFKCCFVVKKTFQEFFFRVGNRKETRVGVEKLFQAKHDIGLNEA
jgi:hypothetical protein